MSGRSSNRVFISSSASNSAICVSSFRYCCKADSNSAEYLLSCSSSFFSAASNELPLLTVAILRKDGVIKDTARNILDQKEAVVHIVDQSVVEEMNRTSAPLPPDQSEIDGTQLTLIDSLSVKVPSIAEAKIRFEGVLHQYVPVKNEKDEIVTDFFFIRVTDFFFDETVFDQEKEYILTDKLNPVARLAGNQYATLDEEFTIVRPS